MITIRGTINNTRVQKTPSPSFINTVTRLPAHTRMEKITRINTRVGPNLLSMLGIFSLLI